MWPRVVQTVASLLVFEVGHSPSEPQVKAAPTASQPTEQGYHKVKSRTQSIHVVTELKFEAMRNLWTLSKQTTPFVRVVQKKSHARKEEGRMKIF